MTNNASDIAHAFAYFVLPVMVGLLVIWFLTWFVTRIAYDTVKAVQEKDARREAAEANARAASVPSGR